MKPKLDIAVSHQGGDWSAVLGSAEEIVCRAASAAWRSTAPTGAAPGGAEISVALADDSLVQALNRNYRGIDRPTNVLAFPTCAPRVGGRVRPIGDVVLALETVVREADASGKSVGDHLSHLVVHGVLHLAGYDHRTDAEAEVMETLEARILAGLGIADPYRSEAGPVG